MGKKNKEFHTNIRSLTKRRHYFRSFANFTLAFILSMTFVALSLLSVLQYHFFQENTIIEILSSSDYYQNKFQEMIIRMEENNTAAGLPSGIAEKIFFQEDLKKDIIHNIELMFRGEVFSSDKEVELRLKNNFMTLMNQTKTTTSTIVKEHDLKPMLEDYNKAIKIPLIDYYMKIKKEYQIIHFLGVAFCVSMIILIIIILIKLNGWLHRTFQFIAYSSMAAAMMLCVAPSILLIKKSYSSLHLMPESFDGFITNSIIDIAVNLLRISAIFALLSIIIIVTGKGIKANLMKFYKLTKG